MNLADIVKKLEKDVRTLTQLVMAVRASGGGGGGGEANTASNVGAGGVGPFNSKIGVDLQFRNINVGSNKLSVALDAPNKEIDLDLIMANCKLDDWAAPDNNTDLDATPAAHGLLPRLDNDPLHFLSGEGLWASTPAAPTYYHGAGSLRYGGWAVYGNGATTWGSCSASLSGGATFLGTNQGPFRKHTCTTTTRGGYFTAYQEIRVNQSPTGWFRIRTESAIADIIIWAGFLNAVLASNADDPATPTIYAQFVYSTTLPNPNWYFATKDGVTQHLVDTGVAVAVSTIYDFKIYLQNGGNAYWWVTPYGGATTSGNTGLNLPPAGQDMGMQIVGFGKVGTVYFDSAYAYYEASL